MALALNLSKGTIDVVVQKDAAVTCTDEEYAQYVQSFAKGIGDEALLKLDGEPTRFTLKKQLGYDASLDVKDRQLGFEDGKPKVRVSFVIEEVRYALVNIKNPPTVAPEATIEFSRDSDGYASKQLIEMLDQAGVVMDLYAARQAAVGSAKVQGLKKK